MFIYKNNNWKSNKINTGCCNVSESTEGNWPKLGILIKGYVRIIQDPILLKKFKGQVAFTKFRTHIYIVITQKVHKIQSFKYVYKLSYMFAICLSVYPFLCIYIHIYVTNH